MWQDALLHAIDEEYVEAVETLLYWEEDHHEPGQPYVRQTHLKIHFALIKLNEFVFRPGKQWIELHPRTRPI